MTGNGKARKNNAECANIKKLISEYIDGETGPAENESVSAHISRCPSCKLEIANMYSMREMIKNVYSVKEKVDFSSSIMARVKTKDAFAKKFPKESKTPLHVTMLRYGAVAAAVFIALAATVLYSQNKTRNTLAEKRKFDTYVVEHSIQTAGDIDSSSQVIAVNFEK